VQEQTVIANFPTADKPAYVYFVRIGKFIKIGFTTNLRGRLKSFRGASAEPIEVLLIIPGGRELEQRLHALFCEDRISNGFFRNEFLLNEFIHGGKDDVAAAFRLRRSGGRTRDRTPAERRLFAAEQGQISERNYQKIVAERIRLRDKAQRKYECCPEKRERPRRR
jgi:hypothetical protein